jgi:dTDP-4-amino-4,6-dideoxygalactose transaminase
VVSAFLFGQLEHLDEINARRKAIWGRYHEAFAELETSGLLRRPVVPGACDHNAHLYYLLLPDRSCRDGLLDHLRERGILAVFHYVPLHLSPMGRRLGYREGQLPVTEELSGRLLRLPLFHTLAGEEQDEVVAETRAFLGAR